MRPTSPGWAAVADDGPFYYRVQSPVVLIEFDHHPGVAFDNVVPSRNHIHTIIRTPNGGDYGIDLLRQHHERFDHSTGIHMPGHNTWGLPFYSPIRIVAQQCAAATSARRLNYGRLCMAVHKGTHRQRPHFGRRAYQTNVSNMATATPLGRRGPDGGEAARRVAQAGRATKARLAPLAVTHRYSRTHCLWLEQFQIAESVLVEPRPVGCGKALRKA
jgi:Protein of unknown function (DUF3500).